MLDMHYKLSYVQNVVFMLLFIGLISVLKDSLSEYLFLGLFWLLRPSNLKQMYFSMYLVKSNRNEIHIVGHFSLTLSMVALSLKIAVKK